MIAVLISPTLMCHNISVVVFHCSTATPSTTTLSRAHFIVKYPEIGLFASCKSLGRVTAINDLVVTFYTDNLIKDAEGSDLRTMIV